MLCTNFVYELSNKHEVLLEVCTKYRLYCSDRHQNSPNFNVYPPHYQSKLVQWCWWCNTETDMSFQLYLNITHVLQTTRKKE